MKIIIITLFIILYNIINLVEFNCTLRRVYLKNRFFKSYKKQIDFNLNNVIAMNEIIVLPYYTKIKDINDKLALISKIKKLSKREKYLVIKDENNSNLDSLNKDLIDKKKSILESFTNVTKHAIVSNGSKSLFNEFNEEDKLKVHNILKFFCTIFKISEDNESLRMTKKDFLPYINGGCN